MKSIAQKSLEITSLFEAELLVRLMLRNWKHPIADDEEFANDLLEGASDALRGAPLFEGLSKKELVELARVTDDLQVPAGTVLCKEDTLGREFFVLVEGTVDIADAGFGESVEAINRQVPRLGVQSRLCAEEVECFGHGV